MTLIANDIQTINVIPFCNIEGHTSSNCQCDSIVLSLPPVLRRPTLSRTGDISSSFRDRLSEIFSSTRTTPLNILLPPICGREGHTNITCSCNW